MEEWKGRETQFRFTSERKEKADQMERKNSGRRNGTRNRNVRGCRRLEKLGGVRFEG